MGFPVGNTEILLPRMFVYTISFLDFIRNLILSLFNFLGLSDFLETGNVLHYAPTRIHKTPPVSATLIRELLPVIKMENLAPSSVNGELPESCAVCLYEFEGGDEIRWLTNCKHIFHRSCLDRWIDHDRSTCPLCRTSFVPDELREEFNQRLLAAAAVAAASSDDDDDFFLQ